jgi:multiple sugar transport system permease protein/putative aldouronate transport system permease protein
VILWPVEVGLEGYKAVFKDKYILNGYMNTIIYTLSGTLINICMTLAAAFPLSRRDLPGRKFLMFIITFTMIFNGGIIPSYILIRSLGMLNTRWALIIPGAISVWNLIITRTFFMTNLPEELSEAAELDGCSPLRFFAEIALPLSKAIIAVITLFYAVSHWNAFFNAFLYLSNQALYPLQIVLRDILVANQIDVSLIDDPELLAVRQGMADLLRYSLIMVACVPVWCLYPFVQRYFVKGVMIGSIKG